jgi:uncharacterized protein (DUF427 family)
MSERVTVEPVPHIRVMLGDQVVAETTRGVVVHEQGLPARYYVPPADVRATLAPGAGAGTCPWKGEWRHLDVAVGDRRVANGAWSYHETKPVTDVAKGFIAFYDTKFSITAE